MSLAWSKLVEIREEIPANVLGVTFDLPVNALPLIGESPHSLERFSLKRWFKIAPHQFIQTRYDSPPRFGGFAWAASDGACACALTGDTFFDDEAAVIPPDDLLPDRTSYDSQAVAGLGRQSGDSHFHDAVVGDLRTIYFRRFHYYYRSRTKELHEPPFFIWVVPTDGPWFEGA